MSANNPELIMSYKYTQGDVPVTCQKCNKASLQYYQCLCTYRFKNEFFYKNMCSSCLKKVEDYTKKKYHPLEEPEDPLFPDLPSDIH